MNTTATVETRLARLESQNRRLRAGVIAMAGVMLAGAAVGWSASQNVPDVIEARKFQVINAEGTASLSMLSGPNGGGFIAVQDGDGLIAAVIAVHANGGGVVSVTNAKTEQAISMGSYKEGSKVEVTNDAGKPVVALSADEDGGGMVGVLDAEGKVVVGLTVTVGGGAVSVSNPATGDTKLVLPTDD